jgi:hypothetical protein
MANLKALRVFSGASPELPLWAVISIEPNIAFVWIKFFSYNKAINPSKDLIKIITYNNIFVLQ